MHQRALAASPLFDNALVRGPIALLGSGPAGLLFVLEACMRESFGHASSIPLPTPVEKRLAYGQRGI